MGQLIARARRTEHKEERRQAILAAGRALLEERGAGELTMAAVGDRVGLAKGTLFLYFATKEALCLDVLDALLGEWFEALDADLERPTRVGPKKLVRVLVESLAHRRVLIRLLAILPNILERNVELAQLVRFKTTLLGRLTRTGELLERHLGLDRGEGARLLVRMNAVVVGLHHATELGPLAREALARPELAVFVVDFDEELGVVLLALLRGLLPDA